MKKGRQNPNQASTQDTPIVSTLRIAREHRAGNAGHTLASREDILFKSCQRRSLLVPVRAPLTLATCEPGVNSGPIWQLLEEEVGNFTWLEIQQFS